MLTLTAWLAPVYAMLPSTLAHLMLESPVPYGKPTLNNSPLDSTGADFPCKLREGVYDVTQMNYWTAGEAQTIRFLGSAVHGGGSCQFSVSEDLQPTNSSRWKVVNSVIGGCPASVEGNLSGGPESRVADTFDVVIPKELPSGRYSFAWTWFNRQGNREMYMNCAPITVRGGGNDIGFFASLPDMFVANLPSSACSTIENVDYVFPNPGSAVLTGRQVQPTAGLTGVGCSSPNTLGSEAVRPADALSHHLLSQLSTHTLLHEQTTVVSSNTASADWLSEAAVKALAVGEMAASDDVASIAQTTQAPASQGSVPPEGARASLLDTAEACVPCPEPNQIICIDNDHYGLCDLGCARSQLLAAGTVCSDGRILRRGA
jgi:hypothetical protein